MYHTHGLVILHCFFVLLQERQTECLLKNNLYTKATLHLALANVILRGKSAILAAHAKDHELTFETLQAFRLHTFKAFIMDANTV